MHRQGGIQSLGVEYSRMGVHLILKFLGSVEYLVDLKQDL